MINGQDLNMALGLPIYLSNFTDKKVRLCYPYKMRDLYKINNYIAFINMVDYDENFKKEESIISIRSLIEESFKNDKLEEVLSAIDDTNFFDVMKDIKTINGLSDESGEKYIEGSSDSIDWSTSVCSIMTYTSNSINDILDMTFTQFNDCLNAIGKKINWEYKTETISLVEDPGEYIEETDHPLAPKKKHKKMMSMNDLDGLI